MRCSSNMFLKQYSATNLVPIKQGKNARSGARGRSSLSAVHRVEQPIRRRVGALVFALAWPIHFGHTSARMKYPGCGAIPGIGLLVLSLSAWAGERTLELNLRSRTKTADGFALAEKKVNWEP